MTVGNQGNNRPALVRDDIRGLELPSGEYVVIDEEGHEAFVPYRSHDERIYHRPSGTHPSQPPDR